MSDKRLRLRYAALLLLTLLFGLVVRFARLPWPYAVSKYGGSALWAMAIFWGVSVIVPRHSTVLRAALALLLAFGIEFFKLVRTPALDAFRLTLPGKLVLGRVFSVRDLAAYALAILCAALLDHFLSTPRAEKHALG